MTKKNELELYKRMEAKGLAVQCSQPSARIHQEKRSLQQLQYKKDYLSLYNRVVRYVFLLLLSNGTDIPQNKVHPALKFFLTAYLGLEHADAAAIVNQRHALKYSGAAVEDWVYELLESCEEDLIEIIHYH